MRTRNVEFVKGKKISGTRLTPLEMVEHFSASKSIAYKCICDCGKEVTVTSSALKSGNTRSCGCLARDVRRNVFTTHGLSKTSEYSAARAAFQRCNNKHDNGFKNYGGRGIKVKFKSVGDMATWLVKTMPKPSGRFLLDRIDNNGHYEPGNLRWSTSRDSSGNRRCSRIVSIGGETKTLARWATESGINLNTLAMRVEAGIPEELLLSKGKITRFMMLQRKFNAKSKSE